VTIVFLVGLACFIIGISLIALAWQRHRIPGVPANALAGISRRLYTPRGLIIQTLGMTLLIVAFALLVRFVCHHLIIRGSVVIRAR